MDKGQCQIMAEASRDVLIRKRRKERWSVLLLAAASLVYIPLEITADSLVLKCIFMILQAITICVQVHATVKYSEGTHSYMKMIADYSVNGWEEKGDTERGNR